MLTFDNKSYFLYTYVHITSLPLVVLSSTDLVQYNDLVCVYLGYNST